MSASPTPQEGAIKTADEQSTAIRDVEKSDGSPNELQRQVSGPPYSVFTRGEKVWITFLVSVSALISPFGATTFYPALNVLSDVLHVTPTMTNISITTYMVSIATLRIFTLMMLICFDRLRRLLRRRSLGVCPIRAVVGSRSSCASSYISSLLSGWRFRRIMLRFSYCASCRLAGAARLSR